MLVFIPVLALVFLKWAPRSARAPRGQFLLPALLAVTVLFVAVRRFFPDRLLYDKPPMAVLNTYLEQLRGQSGWHKHPVVIVEGGSLTAYGVDGPRLEKLLAEKGVEVTVLELAFSGANHYERIKVFRELLDGLPARQKKQLRKADVLLLREVFSGYDESPLHYLDTEVDRNISYTDLHGFPGAWRTAGVSPSPGITRWNLVQSTILNTFGAGLLFRMAPPPRPKSAPYKPFTMESPGGFDFEEWWKKYRERFVQIGELPKEWEREMPPPGWERANEDLGRELKGYVDRVAYFTPPVLMRDEVAYQQAFLRWLPKDTVVFGPMTPGEFAKLKNASFWYDEIHLRGEGAEINTEWLSEQLAEYFRRGKKKN